MNYAGVLPEGAQGRLGKGSVTILELTEDGESLAVGGQIGLYLFDAQSLEEHWSLPSDKPVTAMAFVDNGGLLAAGLEGGTLILVDVEAGEIVKLKEGTGESDVNSLAWQPAGNDPQQLLATGFIDGTILLSAVTLDDGGASVQSAGVLGRAPTGVSAIAFSPNRRILVTGTRSGVIQFWDTESMGLLAEFQGHESGKLIQMLRWSPEGDVLYSTGDDGRVVIWNIRDFTPGQTIEGSADGILAVDLSDDGTSLATVGVDGSLSSWSTADSSNQWSQDTGLGAITAGALSGNGGTLAAVTETGLLHVLDVAEDSLTRRASLEGFAAPNSWVRAMSWHPDGERLAASMWELIIIWDPAEQARLQTLEGHTSLVTSLEYSPDGDRLASAGRDQVVVIWDADSGEELQRLSGHTAGVSDVAWSPDGSRLASVGSIDNQVIVWDTESGEIVESMLGPNEAVWSVAWSPDDSTLAIGTMSGEVVLWDTSDLSNYDVNKYLAHLNWVSDLAWSPDGTWLATAGADTLATIWDVEEGRRLQNMVGHAGPITSLAFGPDGFRLGTSSVDELVMAWDLGSGDSAPEPLQIMSGHPSEVDAVQWSPDGAQLASGARDGTVILWDFSGE